MVLRCGSSQQESSSSQCWSNTPSNLAYTSQRMRATFWVCHSSICPCIFHSFHINSICHRTRSSTRTSAKLSKDGGALLMTSVHRAQSRWWWVTVVPCLCAYSSCAL